MKQIVHKIVLFFTLLVVSVDINAQAAVSNNHVADARILVNTFSGQLKSALVAAMQAGGPVNAVDVCNLKAQPIASKLAAESGWQLGRTALKVRNSSNTPDAWELKVLMQFEERKRAGEDMTAMEYSEQLLVDNKMTFRYMKAIPTAAVCVVCHGSSLGEAVSKKIQYLYPDDQAVGFSVGDIRGAFSLQTIID